MSKLTVAVVHGDLTESDALLLVNASNTNAMLGTGVSGAIRRACGTGYQAHIQAALRATFGGPMEPGECLITDAGTHPHATYVAHLAVMDYRQGFTGDSFPTEVTIERCTQKLWTAVEKLPVETVSVAMVALGAGTGGLGARRPTEITCETLRAHLTATPHSKLSAVTFYGYELTEYVAIVSVVSQFFTLAAGSVHDAVLAFLRQTNGPV